jgi:hypothetical protein
MFYLRRLEGGLFTLQMIDFILAWLIMEDDGVRLFPPSPPPFSFPSSAFAPLSSVARTSGIDADLLGSRSSSSCASPSFLFPFLIDLLPPSLPLYQARDQALLLLSRKDQTFQEIIDVLQEQYDNIGDPLPPPGPSEGGEEGAREEWEAEQGKVESQRIILEGLMAYLKGMA